MTLVEKMLLVCFMTSLVLEPLAEMRGECTQDTWAVGHHSSQFNPHISLCPRDRIHEQPELSFHVLTQRDRSLLVSWLQRMEKFIFPCILIKVTILEIDYKQNEV